MYDAPVYRYAMISPSTEDNQTEDAVEKENAYLLEISTGINSFSGFGTKLRGQ